MKKNVWTRLLVSIIVFCEVVCVSLSGTGIVFAYDKEYTLPVLVMDQKTDIVKIAESQLGYPKNNGTVYGAWYTNYIDNGIDYTDLAWCAMFVTWCAKRAGVEEGVIPAFSYCATGINNFKKLGVWHEAGCYIPKVGDIIFFTYSHVGIVVDVTDTTVTTIEGNKTSLNSAVGRTTYKLNHSSIKGYASPDYNGSSNYTIPNRTLYKKSPLMNGSDVKWLQQSLSTLGFEVYPDGYLGNNTDIVIKNFQKAYGLEVDGMVGKATRTKIIELLDAIKYVEGNDDEALSNKNESSDVTDNSNASDGNLPKDNEDVNASEDNKDYSDDTSVSEDNKDNSDDTNISEENKDNSDDTNISEDNKDSSDEENDNCTEDKDTDCDTEDDNLTEDDFNGICEHNYILSKTNPATCIKKGSNVHKCSLCGDEFSEEIDTIEHLYGEWIVEREATYTEEGLKYKACSMCGDRQEGTIKKLVTIDLSKAQISVSTKSYTYNKTYRRPAVFVKYNGKYLVQGKDYKVQFSNNYYPGTATVKAIGINGYKGTLTTTFKINVGKVSKLKASAVSSNYVRLNWDKVTGASGYQIQRYDSASKSYKNIATISGNTFKNTSVKAGTNYNYRVRAYTVTGGKKVYGSWSDVLKTGTKSSAVSITTKSTAKKKATISWNKTTGASYYEVYRANSKNGKYTLVKTLSSSKTSYTNSSLTSKKTYYYKVRSYRVVNGKKVYSSYSAIKSVKIK